MKPEVQKAFDEIHAQIASGPADQVVTAPNGERLRVRRSPEPGVAAIVESLETHNPVSSITWEAAQAPPAGYPADLPFLAGRMTMLSTLPGSRNLQWHKATPDDAASVALALMDDGWKETTLPAPSMPGMLIRPFRRHDRQRIIVLGGDLLGLVETRAE